LKANGAAQVLGPVTRGLDFCGDGLAGEIGDEVEPGRGEGEAVSQAVKGSEDGVHEGGMEGMGDVEQSGCDALGLEAVTDFTEGVLVTGDDSAEGGIDGGDGERRGKGFDGGGDAIFGGHDGGHLTDGWQGLHECGALGDELEAVFEREDAGDAGGDVFADAV